MEHSDHKIFFIGANKTGTSSILRSLKQAGIAINHNLEFVLSTYSKPDNLEFFSRYQAFSDGCGHDYKWLDENFPNAKFVLLTRDDENWLNSKYNHTIRDASKSFTNKIYLKLIDSFPGILQKQLADKILYEKRVLRYFESKPDKLLTIDIEKDGDSAFEKLSVFLGIEVQPIHHNKRNDEEDYEKKDRFPRMVERESKRLELNIGRDSEYLNYPVYPALSEFLLRKINGAHLAVYRYARVHNTETPFRKNIRNLSSVLSKTLITIIDRKNRLN